MQREPVTIGRYLTSRGGESAKSGPRSWLEGIFGCSHKQMSRPFSRQGETYRVCLTCGARRQFVESTWEMTGPFYFGAIQNGDAVASEIRAQRIVRRPKLVKSVA
jgi:hypothetical protein